MSINRRDSQFTDCGDIYFGGLILQKEGVSSSKPETGIPGDRDGKNRTMSCASSRFQPQNTSDSAT